MDLNDAERDAREARRHATYAFAAMEGKDPQAAAVYAALAETHSRLALAATLAVSAKNGPRSS